MKKLDETTALEGVGSTVGLAADEPPRYNSVVAGQLLCIRDALIMGDHNEAYHLLYLIADPNLCNLEPWAEMERIALAANLQGNRTRRRRVLRNEVKRC